jgi:hypothetical protein
MANKSGAIGTRTAQAVCKTLRNHGFPYAERRDENGAYDRGDIAGCGTDFGDVCWQVKGGHAAEDASLAKVREWLAETEVQRTNAKADVGILVRKRKGVGDSRAHLWHAEITEATYRELLGRETGFWDVSPERHQAVLSMTLEEIARLLVRAGFGSSAVPRQREAIAS